MPNSPPDLDLVVHGNTLPPALAEDLGGELSPAAVEAGARNTTRLHGAARPADFEVRWATRLDAASLDWAFVPAARRLEDFRLVAFDMDSTLITIECIDELADFAGRKEEVAAITEAAMRGELDYRESLRLRLATLAGLDARVLARVFAERLRLSPGVPELLAALRGAGIHTALLSGGFTYFTERLRIELGLDFATSNELEIDGGRLTGRVVGAVVDAQAKADTLRRLMQEFGLAPAQVMAVGDGANDLPMMAVAGTSVAYRAKPATRRRATHAINHGGLDGILALYPPRSRSPD